MVSFKSAVIATTMAFASIAKAGLYVDPDSVPESTRQNWCASELSTCPIICQQTTNRPVLVNDCDPDTLSFGCLCGDNKQPNVSEYTLTLPFFICQEYVVQCRAKCGSDNTCASNCAEDHPCGATDPKRYNSTSTATSPTPASTSTSTTAGPDTIYTGTPGGGSSSNNNKGKSMAAPMVEVGRAYGMAILLSSMFVGFALL